MAEIMKNNTSMQASPFQRYPVQQWYPVSAVLCVLISLLFVWQLLQGFEPGALLFLMVCLAVAGWQWRAARTEVALGADRLLVAAPLGTDHEIEFGQLLDVVQEGRVNPTILIMYHPRNADGLLDLDDVQTVTLPAVQDQTALLERLEGHIPQ
jgi:hypothetical protein